MLQKIIPWILLTCSYASAVHSSTPARVLVYTSTKGFRHDSIPTAVEALNEQSSAINVIFNNTEDQTQFTDEILAGYDAIMFLSTTGEGSPVLDDSGKTAFQNYLNSGGNFMGVHSASDSLLNTTFYKHELGAFFDYHPILQNATVDVLVASHPSTSMLPVEWHIQEEMYNFESDPREIGATVLLAANESSYVDNGTRNFDQGTPHPSAWFQDHGAGVESGHLAGRSFYTSLGHLNETWQDPLFIAHITGGLTWVLQANTTRAFNSSALVGNSGSSSNNTGPSSNSTESSDNGATATVSLGYIGILTGLMVVGGAAWLQYGSASVFLLNS